MISTHIKAGYKDRIRQFFEQLFTCSQVQFTSLPGTRAVQLTSQQDVAHPQGIT